MYVAMSHGESGTVREIGVRLILRNVRGKEKEPGVSHPYVSGLLSGGLQGEFLQIQ